jgi:PmbA protein
VPDKPLEELQNRAKEVVRIAKEMGAKDSWATASRSRSVDYIWRDGKIEQVQDSTSRAVSVEIYVDGRYAVHTTTDLRAGYLATFISEAVALTRALEPDEFRQIPSPSLFANRPNIPLEQMDLAIPALKLENRDVWCREMDAVMRADSRVISATSTVSDGHSMTAMASSNGFLGAEEETSVWLVGEVTVRDEGDKKPEGYHYTGGHQMRDLEKAPEVARKALERALSRLGTRKGPTGRLSMVVDRQASGRLISALLGPARASAIQQKRSFWEGRIGQQVFGEALSLVDNPLLPRGLGSRLFDGEGISARSWPLVDRGTILNIYVDTYYGRKLGMSPTTGSSSNVILPPGEKSLDELLADAGSGVYVTSWLGGNSDATTGDFSFGIRGHLIENGKIGAPIGETNVTGNLMDLFRNLVTVGNDPWPYSSVRVPSLLFKDIQFSGA